MIIPKAEKLTDEQLSEIREIAGQYKVTVDPIEGTHRTIYAMKGDERHESMITRIEGLPYIDRVDTMLTPYKLMDIHSELSSHKVMLNGKILGTEVVIIAGHCTIDPKNANLFYETAQAVTEAGADLLRGGVWKPRTNPYSYQGDIRALDILLEARRRFGIPVCTEIMDPENLHACVDAGIDCLQIGTRNALNYSLLREVGRGISGLSTTVLLKRSRHMGPIAEFILAGEYIAAHGNPNVILCPRGTLPALDGYRNHPDESIVPLLKQKTWAPVIVDPSHSVGRAIYVPQAAMAAVAYGADGLVIETHIDPKRGLGDDPKQAITPDTLRRIIEDARRIYQMKKKYTAYMKQ